MTHHLLEKKLEEKTTAAEHTTPQFFDLKRSRDRKELLKLFRIGNVQRVMDDYREELTELFAIQNPTRVYTPGFHNGCEQFIKKIEKRHSSLARHGKWVYFSWLGAVVHILDEKEYCAVRTARNQNLITKKEQERFYNAVIGIAGLSVGNSVALAIVLQGGAKRIKLADHDTLALSNTNRIRTSITNLGLPKVVLTARQIYELNPYAKIECFSEGLTEKNSKKFFLGLDLIIDEVDHLATKYLIRMHARKNHIPVLMGADNGDNAVIDIERYDKTPRMKFFHGRMGAVSYGSLAKLTKPEIGRMIARHVGPENVAPRMQESLREIGKTIVSWPQLGGAALLNGSIIAYCARRVLTGGTLESNRALISLDEKLVPNYRTHGEVKKRKRSAKLLKKLLSA